MHTKTWHLHVDLSEQDELMRAEVVLQTDAGTELRHVGRARRRAGDRDVPEIGGVRANDLEGATPDVRLDWDARAAPGCIRDCVQITGSRGHGWNHHRARES